MRLQLIGVVMVTGVATVAVIEHTYGSVEAGMHTSPLLLVLACFPVSLRRG